MNRFIALVILFSVAIAPLTSYGLEREISIILDRDSLLKGEEVRIRIVNTGESMLKFQGYLLKIRSCKTGEIVKYFLQEEESEIYIRSGETYSEITWDQRDLSGNPVEEGNYYIIAEVGDLRDERMISIGLGGEERIYPPTPRIISIEGDKSYLEGEESEILVKLGNPTSEEIKVSLTLEGDVLEEPKIKVVLPPKEMSTHVVKFIPSNKGRGGVLLLLYRGAHLLDVRPFGFSVTEMKLPELEIRKTAELSKEHLRVVIHLENVGKDIARDVYLSDSYPPSLFEIISGITEWKGEISPGEDVSIEYELRMLEGGITVSLPPAIVSFRDEKGRSYSLKSNSVEVSLPPMKYEEEEKKEEGVETREEGVAVRVGEEEKGVWKFLDPLVKEIQGFRDKVRELPHKYLLFLAVAILLLSILFALERKLKRVKKENERRDEELKGQKIEEVEEEISGIKEVEREELEKTLKRMIERKKRIMGDESV